jgi:hypothetical protein
MPSETENSRTEGSDAELTCFRSGRPCGPSLSGIPPAAGTASTRNRRSWRNRCRNASCGRSPRSPSKWPHVPGNFSRMQPNGSLSCSLILHYLCRTSRYGYYTFGWTGSSYIGDPRNSTAMQTDFTWISESDHRQLACVTYTGSD